MKKAKSSQLAFLPRTQAMKFPYKLHEILNFAEKNEMENIISWHPGGKGFSVHNRDLFCANILKHVCNHSNYKSFQKQLRNWSFDFTPSENGESYSHPNFVRGRKSLCMKMTSKNSKTKQKKNVVVSDVTTDFSKTSLRATTEKSVPPKLDNLLSKIEFERMNKEAEGTSLRTKPYPPIPGRPFGRIPTSILVEAASSLAQERQRHVTSFSSLASTKDQFPAGIDRNKVLCRLEDTVQQRDSGITSCLRRSKRKWSSIPCSFGGTQGSQSGSLTRSLSLSTDIEKRLRNISTQVQSSSASLLDYPERTVSLSTDIENRLGNVSTQVHSSSDSLLDHSKIPGTYNRIGFDRPRDYELSLAHNPALEGETLDQLIDILEKKRMQRTMTSSTLNEMNSTRNKSLPGSTILDRPMNSRLLTTHTTGMESTPLSSDEEQRVDAILRRNEAQRELLMLERAVAEKERMCLARSMRRADIQSDIASNALLTLRGRGFS